MKAALKISFLLNLGLAGVLIYILAHQSPQAGNAPPVATAAGGPAPSATVSATPVVQPAEPKPFHWTQLESPTDYRVYVANLRTVGCPEPTVEDIVRGDAERAFFAKRRELHVDGTVPGPWSAQAQMQLVASLLGKALAGAQGGSIPPSLCPLVLRDVDLNALGLSDEQKERVAGIREEFIENIGGANQDPSDPAYLARWQKAQHVADEELRGWLGTQGALEYSLAADAARNQ